MPLVFDIEADGFLRECTKVHCISTYDTETHVLQHFGPGDVEQGIQYLSSADVLVGHNICSFDIPAIKKLYPWFTHKGLIDTFLLSCMLFPNDGALSLEDWALRLSLETQKVQHEDWSKYSVEMAHRCNADVKINAEVFKYLRLSKHYDMVKGDPLDLEQRVAQVHSQQVLTGVRFDIVKAVELLKVLDKRIEEIRTKIVSLAPKKVHLCRTPVKNQDIAKVLLKEAVRKGELVSCDNPFKADGSFTVNALKYWGDDIQYVKGPHTRIEVKELNPDSDGEIRELLLGLGWIPTEWNSVKDKATGEFRRTSPKLTEDSFASLPEGLGKLIGEYNTLNHRRSWLLSKDNQGGAIMSFKNRGDGRVSAEAFTCGTNTARYRHQGTVCNIPRPGSILGEEVRSLFCVPEDAWMVGIDLSGIEIRMLAHYLLVGNYKDCRGTADAILSGDFHIDNATMWGVDRNTAKTGLYALVR